MIIKRSVPWHARSTLSRSAHVIARIGLALTGTACGLFVAEVSARIDLVGSVEAMLAMMFYFTGPPASISGSICPRLLPITTCTCRHGAGWAPVRICWSC